MSRSGSSLSCLAVGVLLGSTPCQSSVKGGSLEGISPYGSWERIDVIRVKAEQRKSNQLREVRCDVHRELRYVTGFAQVRADGTREALSPFLTVWDGTKRSKVALSQIAGIVVKAKDSAGRRVQCEITVFPDMSPEALVRYYPNYTTLAARHTSRRLVWIRDGTIASGRMALVGRGTPDQSAPEVRVAFADMPPGSRLRFHDPDILSPSNYWWAIRSVATDPKYPYRWPPTAP